jgi:hypothetical protein
MQAFKGLGDGAMAVIGEVYQDQVTRFSLAAPTRSTPP